MHDAALAMFHKVCLANIGALHTLPAVLPTLGFIETQRMAFRTGPEDTSILFKHPDMPFAFCCFEGRKDWPSIVSLVAPDTAEARAEFMAFVKAQPTLNETTQQVWKRTAWFPSPRHGQLSKGRFWSAKPIGGRGMELGILPSLFTLCGGPAVELSLERILMLQDRPSPAEQAALIAEGTPLQKMVRLFKEVALDNAPDLRAIANAARARGFAAETKDATSGRFCGGQGEDSKPMDIFVSFEINNYNSENERKFEFEVALNFLWDDYVLRNERVSNSQIRRALFRALGVSDKDIEGTATLTLHGEAYRVSHWAVSEALGNHYFLLQK